MPNTTVPVAGEAMPATNRRLALLAGLTAVAAFWARPADATDKLATASPIMTLWREWEAHYRAAGDDVPEDVSNAHMTRCCEIEVQMKALPSTSAADFAAKFIVSTGYGDWIDDDSSVMDEALQLVRASPNKDDNLSSLAANEASAKTPANLQSGTRAAFGGLAL